LTPRQKRITYGRPAYYHAVRSYLSDLRAKGYLTQDSEGLYVLTSAGIPAVKLN
jgi:predicted transcriptional regulator